MADVERFLLSVERELLRRGLPKLSQEQLAAMLPYIDSEEFAQKITTGGWTPQRLADEVQAALQASAEGGFVNDASGRATLRARQGLNLPSPEELR